MSDKQIPTLFEWAGGMTAIERWIGEFYSRVRDDEVLAPIFAHMKGDHPKFVAQFVAEVLGGPGEYSSQRGGHSNMIRAHLEKHLNHDQRKRWVGLLLETGDAVGLPDDPEFRSAIVGYFEWGSRLAVINSQPDAEVDVDAPMPKWGWGEVGGPYDPDA